MTLVGGASDREDAPDDGHREVTGAAAHLDRCLDDVQRWIGPGLAGVCGAAGLDRAVVLRLHGLAASAVAAVGERRAREWFHAGTPSPVERLAAGDPAAFTAVGRDLRRA